MIWLDSSYVIARLLGEPRASFSPPPGAQVILPAQLAETFVYLERAGAERENVARHIEILQLHLSTREECAEAARLYAIARKTGAKASLADALLAAAVHTSRGQLLTFDNDFGALGFKRNADVWSIAT